MVHTTGKAALGGLHEGLLSVMYHVFTSFRVMRPPNIPPTCGRAVKLSIGIHILSNVGFLAIAYEHTHSFSVIAMHPHYLYN